MSKTNASFNMSRVTKYKLGSYTDPVARNFYKKMMIEAEAALTSAKNRKFNDPSVAAKGPTRASSNTP